MCKAPRGSRASSYSWAGTVPGNLHITVCRQVGGDGPADGGTTACAGQERAAAHQLPGAQAAIGPANVRTAAHATSGLD